MAFDKLDLGITSTQELDSMEAAEAFLSGSTEDIQEIDNEKEKEKPAPTKKPAAKPVKKKVVEEESDEDVEEEETEEENPDLLDFEDEEEDPKKKKKEAAEESEEEDDPEEQAEDESEENHFEAISRTLYQLGIFSPDGEDEPVATNGEELAQLFEQNSQTRATRYLEQFLGRNGEDRMDLFNAIFVNGVDPREYLPAYNQALDFEEMDLAVESNQERVFREFYQRQKLSAERIEQKLQKAKDYGDLEDDVQEMHQRLLEQDQEKVAQLEESKKAEKAQKEAAEQAYKASVQQTLAQALKSKELDGYPVTEEKARQAMDFLTTPKYKLPNGELLTEWDKLILESKKDPTLRARIALLHINNWDLTKVGKKAISKETNELFSSLKKTSTRQQNKKISTPSNDDYWKRQV